MTKKKIRLGLVVPHIFIYNKILPHVIFSPGELALALCNGLADVDVDVTFFSPGPANVAVPNITADLSYFEQELKGRGDDYVDLLKKHPFTFVTLARQVQSELIAKAYEMANEDKLDVIHVYTNEEDIALPFSKLCNKPVVFTHHDPYNFLVKYKNVFPKYQNLPFISLSQAQRKTMPTDTNWVANIYHGLSPNIYKPNYQNSSDYILYLGRVIEPKGVHLAIEAIKKYNTTHNKHMRLKIVGKHYTDKYYESHIEPNIDGKTITYKGFINNQAVKNRLLANARALIIPSIFDEPFGMVMIEALACATPIIGLDSGAISEIIQHNKNGILVKKSTQPQTTILRLSQAIDEVADVDRHACRHDFEERFSLHRMCSEHANVYQKLLS